MLNELLQKIIKTTITFLVMDNENIEWMKDLGFSRNVYLLKEFVGLDGEIEDPWYTGRYEKVVQELLDCGELLIKKLAVF